jgi:hypothetical protein
MKILCGRFTFALNQNITALSASMICYASIAYQFLTFAIASAFIKKLGRNLVLLGRLYITIQLVNDPPETMDQTAYTSEVQPCAGGFRKIGRPGKEDRAMVNIPRIKTKKNSVWYSTRKNRRACGVSLWSEHKTKSLLGWRQLPRSRNSNREVWESPYLQVGVDVNFSSL